MEGFSYKHMSSGPANSSSAPSSEGRKPRVRIEATPQKQFGIVPRAVKELFDRVSRMRDKSVGAEAEGFE
eukprot:CAMPEP_0183478918 /NCGR_PEP_ID=MMETSP0370-20130417/170745_1 /TAXON_ID=268820 /ORGANISM="Peridinium aciculiferum, Strain PAER-2" /LENGTH=69 /DNA_ID=CAMNT_0025671893 /DNA_START=13 /DNA_END=219 /DNA_ORIENTATION=-